MRGTAATRVKKPRPRTAGVSATEHGRAQAMVEQLQAHVTELEEELEATREGTPSATGEEEIARLKAYIAELEAALDPARDPSDAEVKDALAVLKDPASHNEVQQALAAYILFGGRAKIESLKARIRELEGGAIDDAEEEEEEEGAEPVPPANPDLSWTGDETKGFLARGCVTADEPIASTVTPVNVLGSGSQFEANIVTTRNFDFNLRVKQLAARYGISLHTPVPTVAEAKALVEADYAQR